jgi:uncharacterized membrane protein
LAATASNKPACAARRDATQFKGKKPAPAKAAKNVKRAAKVTKAAASTAPAPTPKGIAKVAARKTLKFVARKAAQTSAAMIRHAAERVADTGKNAIGSAGTRRPPIQFGVNVAVPIDVVWEEWLSYGLLPEGVQRIEDVERDGDVLIGRTAGPRSVDWEAEIMDERENESFAWRSVDGTDCAGLVTFHRISDRLTRIEIDLDVLPTNPAEAFALATHVADRRAMADLRKFKAHVEFINPDAYQSDGRPDVSVGTDAAEPEREPAGEDEA